MTAGAPSRPHPSPTWTVVAFIGALVILHFIHLALLPFVVSGIIGFVADPLIRRLCKRLGWPRWVVATSLYLLILIGLGALAYAAAASAWDDAAKIAATGSLRLHALLLDLLGPGGRSFLGHSVTADSVTASIVGVMDKAVSLNLFATAGGPLLGAGAALVLSVILSLYMMISGPGLVRGMIWMIPPAGRGAVERLLPLLSPVLRRYFVAILAVVGFTVAASWLAYGLVLHLPGALVLSVAVGLLETLPLIGPTVAWGLVTLAALQASSPLLTAAALGYSIVLRLVIDDLFVPLVLGRTVSLNPVAVIFAYVVGGLLFGVVGLLLAAPFAAGLRIVLQATYEPDANPAQQPWRAPSST